MSLIVGDCREVMRRWISEGVRVQCCVTSPPYWGLRDYGTVGQLGLEPTIAEYVANMVEVFRMVRDLLADDGTLWLNLGDSYATGAGKVGDCPGGGKQGEAWKSYGPARPQVPDGKNPDAMVPTYQPNRMPQAGLKPKDLCGIPWRVAFALQADGWWLRQDIIWSKLNPMPESVTDRCTKAHEYLFLLAKSERYYYDAAAIAEPSQISEHGRYDMASKGIRSGLAYVEQAGVQNNSVKVRSPAGWKTGNGAHGSIHSDGREQEVSYAEIDASKRNRRSVWTIATQPYPEAHFATFPHALVEPCVMAGSRVGDTILDPFMGSGTVGQVAQDLGRKWLGCDLNPEYARMTAQRTAQLGLELYA